MKICDHHIENAARIFGELDGDTINAKMFAAKMFLNYFDSIQLLRHLVELGLLVEIDTQEGSEANQNQTELFKHQEVSYEAHN